MTMKHAEFYWGKCDFPGCEAQTSDFDTGNTAVYNTPEKLVHAMQDTWEGSLGSDYGWLDFHGRYYCGDHVEWDEEGIVLIPKAHPEEVPAPVPAEDVSLDVKSIGGVLTFTASSDNSRVAVSGSVLNSKHVTINLTEFLDFADRIRETFYADKLEAVPLPTAQ